LLQERSQPVYDVSPVSSTADEELRAALDIFAASLGAGVYGLSALIEQARGPGKVLLAARSAQGRRVVAVGGAELIVGGGAYHAPFGPAAVDLLASHRCGNLSSLGVARDWRGKGGGSAVLDAQIQWVAAQGCDLAVSIAWMSNRPPMSHQMLERRGFACLAEVPEFYFVESVRYGWSCPSCGGHCRCAARLYVRRLEGRA
jgi:GNAT superfamily N-acetyltransferase